MNKLIKKGEEKLERALDTRSIIKLSHTLKTLLRYNFSKPARKIIGLQRRYTVLEQKDHDSDSTDFEYDIT